MKYDILKMLEKSEGSFISGEEISRCFAVTRAGVWKHIRELRNEGYNIEALSKCGYKLMGRQKPFNQRELEESLSGIPWIKRLIYYKTTDSTNNQAKSLASAGADEGTLVIADAQTGGKGRMGKYWLSQEGKGIWMSLILRPELPPLKIQLLTLAISCAVSSALDGFSASATGIKWPNDIIINNRKVCGILLEMSSEADRIHYICAGIGINVSQRDTDFPIELRNTAISLFQTRIKPEADVCLNSEANAQANAVIDEFDRCDIIRRVIENIEYYYSLIKTGGSGIVLESWRSRNITLGRQVRIIYTDKEEKAYACGISEDGSLIVKTEGGEIKAITSGEVSVRGIMGYT